jgi:hypothetical protein
MVITQIIILNHVFATFHTTTYFKADDPIQQKIKWQTIVSAKPNKSVKTVKQPL